MEGEVFRHVTHLLYSEMSPLPCIRGNTRDVTPRLRPHAASALDRLIIGTNVASGVLLDDDALDLMMAASAANIPLPDDLMLLLLEASDPFFRVAAENVYRPMPFTLVPPPRQSPMRISDYSEAACYDNFRFTRDQLARLFRCFDLPRSIRGIHSHYFDREECLLVGMRFMCNGGLRMADVGREFSLDPRLICEMFATFKLILDSKFGHLVDESRPVPGDWAHPTGLARWAPQLALWACASL